jgi:hypothetical protein
MKNSEIRDSRTGYDFLLIFLLLSAGITAGGYVAYRNYKEIKEMSVKEMSVKLADLARLLRPDVFYRDGRAY